MATWPVYCVLEEMQRDSELGCVKALRTANRHLVGFRV